MNFTMTTPCDNCPFRRTGFIALRQDRVREIAAAMVDRTGQGASFPCHKTVEWDEEGEHDINRLEQQHCAGALIFSEKHGRPTQLMRIAERVGSYDRRKLRDQDAVFDSLSEMLAVHRAAFGHPRRRRRAP